MSRALQGAPVSPGFAARLAERRGLTPAQIRTAVRFARLADVSPDAGADPQATGTMEALIQRQLANADKVAILRAYLKRWKAEVDVFFDGVGPEASDGELLEIAPQVGVRETRRIHAAYNLSGEDVLGSAL